MQGNDMPEFKDGTLVRHRGRPAWGLGKVLSIRGDEAQVYFKGREGAIPEDKVVALKMAPDRLDAVPPVADVELDHLPPYDAGTKKFKRPNTRVDLQRSKLLFQTRYRLGFQDPLYHSIKDERAYKVAAHHRFTEILPQLEDLAASATGEQIRSALDRVYRGDRGSEIEGLNLLHPRFEMPHYLSALDDDASARAYLVAAIGFLKDFNRASFDRYASAVAQMQWIEGKGDKGMWPLFSWLPFVADPQTHMMIRPTVAREFASAMGFDLQLTAELDYSSYSRVLTMSQQLREILQDSELNLARRPLDMIDVQSFMWVAMRHFEPNALDSKEG